MDDGGRMFKGRRLVRDGIIYFELYDYLKVLPPVQTLIEEFDGKSYMRVDCLSEGDMARASIDRDAGL